MRLSKKIVHTYIIAEAGVNHNGKLDVALELCDEAKKAGADAVKFQTWKTDLIITKKVCQAEYQKMNTGVEESQYDMLRRLELSYDDFREIKKHCDKIGITFCSTADEAESLDFLIDLGIPFIKIGSGEIGNIPYLRYAGGKNLPIILSTGMSTYEDIDGSVNALVNAGASDITLLHCTTSYPCEKKDVNLLAMKSLAEKYRVNVGYSDHTIGSEVAVAAVALGAKVLEKHFTLDKNMPGPDHKASADIQEFAEYVRAVRDIEVSLGNPEKGPTLDEREILKVVRKRVVAAREIYVGERFTEDNITVKRNDEGELPSKWDELLGMHAQKKYCVDDPIMIE